MTPSPPEDEGALWYDDEAGPMVRAYTITGGRTRPDSDGDVDLIAVMVAAGTTRPGHAVHTAAATVSEDGLDDEHLTLLDLCRDGPLSVADLASEADLAVGVVRVLLGDLLREGHLRAIRPVPPAELPDVGVLQDVINGLRAL
ncbi:DUF742 domain-containing protein [Streptomyces sp. NPDC088354]|uniref:DUF742 domain-containing protein n=1 Tax=unclassified Streptomyces TaxID=2593676 RepID=UPI0029B328E8|nr:DUF742 domain-containing protein [Streptomyces sp. MI02-7b]MDX3071494.1 DUF742 domain-containing protein [Streptomyces sp. MI02-7b]